MRTPRPRSWASAAWRSPGSMCTPTCAWAPRIEMASNTCAGTLPDHPSRTTACKNCPMAGLPFASSRLGGMATGAAKPRGAGVGRVGPRIPRPRCHLVRYHGSSSPRRGKGSRQGGADTARAARARCGGISASGGVSTSGGISASGGASNSGGISASGGTRTSSGSGGTTPSTESGTSSGCSCRLATPAETGIPKSILAFAALFLMVSSRRRRR